MSMVRRVLSGSLASWTKIGIGVGVQLALVPLYLGHWSLAQYGCWLVIQGVAAFVNVLSLAHHNFVGNEMLRAPRGSAEALSRLLSAAWPFSMGWGLIEVLALASLVGSGALVGLFDTTAALPSELLDEAQWSLVLLCATTFISVSTSGLYGRIAAALGCFPRTAWWGAGIQVLSALTPVAAVMSGHSLSTTAWTLAITQLLAYGAYQWDLLRLARRAGVHLQSADLALGWSNFRASTVLGASYLLGLVRQQGLRVLVSATLGVTQTVAFTTMRTASNLSLQGIATIVDPLFPEFMGFVRDRNRPAIVGTFAFLWLTIVFVLGPALVLLQALVPTLFAWWTRGQVAFDPWVFASFSASMLVFALARPADAILLGQNRLRAQFGIAAFAALTTAGGMIALDGVGGLQAVAGLLLLVEAAVAVLAVQRAASVLSSLELQWPTGLFRFALAEVMVCTACLAWLAGRPADAAAAVSVSVMTTLVLLAGFMTQLPSSHRQWLQSRLMRVCRLERSR